MSKNQSELTVLTTLLGFFLGGAEKVVGVTFHFFAVAVGTGSSQEEPGALSNPIKRRCALLRTIFLLRRSSNTDLFQSWLLLLSSFLLLLVAVVVEDFVNDDEDVIHDDKEVMNASDESSFLLSLDSAMLLQPVDKAVRLPCIGGPSRS